MKFLRTIGVLTLLPVVLATAILALGSVYPLRLDYRTFQALRRLEGLEPELRNGKVVFLSRDNGTKNAEIQAYALRHLQFPHGTGIWLTLRESSGIGWSTGFLSVDRDGRFYGPRTTAEGWEWESVADPDLTELLKGAVVLYDSEATRTEFEQRLEVLRRGWNVRVLGGETVSANVVRAPRSEFTWPRLWRLSALCGEGVAAVVLLRNLTRTPPSPPLRKGGQGGVLAAGAAIFGLTGCHLAALYLVGEFAASFGPFLPLVLWGLLAAGAAVPVAAPADASSSLKAGWSFILVVGIACFLYLGMATLLLDFEGDVYTSYLQVARFDHLLGKHDPAAFADQGYAHATTYPPAYPLFLAVPLWAADAPPADAYNFGLDTCFVLLLYRLLAGLLNLTALAMFGAYLATLGGRQTYLWPAGVVAAFFVLPTLGLHHIAAETLLFPMTFASLICLTAGPRLGRSSLTASGLFIAGTATLVKWDGTIYLVFLGLPTLLAAVRWKAVGWRSALLLALGIAFLPTLYWKSTVTDRDTAFDSPTVAGFLAAKHLLPGLATRALTMLLRTPLWVPLLALPVALAWRWRWDGLVRSMLVPVGVGALVVAWAVIFVFCKAGAFGYLETSYLRIVMAPVALALLYVGETTALGVVRGQTSVGEAPCPT